MSMLYNVQIREPGADRRLNVNRFLECLGHLNIIASNQRMSKVVPKCEKKFEPRNEAYCISYFLRRNDM